LKIAAQTSQRFRGPRFPNRTRHDFLFSLTLAFGVASQRGRTRSV